MKVKTIYLFILLILLSSLYFYIKHPISYLILIPIAFISGELGFRYAVYTEKNK